MFEVGFTEIILIMGLALLVLGPERLPELARKVGRWTGKARAMARQFQTQLEQEVTIEQITRADNERRIHPAAPPTSAASTNHVPADFTDPTPHIPPPDTPSPPVDKSP